MVHILHSSTVGSVGSLRIVVPNRPASHNRAYVYCSLRGKRGTSNESFVIFLDDLSIENYSASSKSVKDGVKYVKKNLSKCKAEWNRTHPNFPVI